MGPKKSSYGSTGKERIKAVRKTIESKKVIIAKLENGARVSDLAAQYNMAKFTISTFLKNKETITAADVANAVTTVHYKKRPHKMDEVEKLLLI